MDSKKMLDALKELLGITKPEEVQEETSVINQKFATSTLKNGIVISYDELVIDAVVSKVLEDGSVEDLEAGDYEMEDGTIIVIGEGSKITEIKPVEEAPVEEVEQAEEEKPVEEEAANPLEDRIKMIEDKLVKIEEVLVMIAEKLDGQTEEYSKNKTDLSKRIESLEKAPAAEPIHYSAEVKVEGESIAQKRLRILNQK